MTANAWPETWLVEMGTTPGMVPAVWESVTARLLEENITVDYGRPDELSPDDTGTASLMFDNLDGHFGVGIKPSTAIRITNTLATVTRPVLYQMVESAPSVYPASGTDAVVDVSLADGMTLLAREDRDAVTRPQERTGARIGALLDLAGWPATLRDIDPGVVLVDALDDVSLNLLSGIRDAVEAEQGQVFIGPDGVFTVRDRHARLDAPTMVVFGGPGQVAVEATWAGTPIEWAGTDATWGTEPTDGVTYQNLVPKYDDATLWTVGRAEMADGRVFEWVDDAAVAVYDRRTFPVRDSAVSSQEAEMLGLWMVLRYSEPARRFETLEVQAADAVSLETVMTMRPGQLVRIQSAAVGGGLAVDELVHVEKVSHDIGTSVWRSTFHLSPYFGAGPWFMLDDDVLGLPNDMNALAP